MYKIPILNFIKGNSICSAFEHEKTYSQNVYEIMKLIFSFIADEEVGGHDGMEKYVVSKEFKELNIGFALDEGLASEENAIPVFYGERNVFWVQFKCHGTYYFIYH